MVQYVRPKHVRPINIVGVSTFLSVHLIRSSKQQAIMLGSWWWLVWFSTSAYVCDRAVGGSECLLGCALLETDPFDTETGLIKWNDQGACDAATTGCTVDTGYFDNCIGSTSCLWTSASGVDGSSACTCNVCASRDSNVEDYMIDFDIWTRIQCYIAAAEYTGFDMSACVAAVLAKDTIPCVNETYASPSLAYYECDDSTLSGADVYVEDDVCIWPGESQSASEIFPPSARTDTGSAGTECLLACSLLEKNPFNATGGGITWNGHSACDATTIGCAIDDTHGDGCSTNGCMWASSSGAAGSSTCTCNMCSSTGSIDEYMLDHPLWTRIQCYIAAAEYLGYDMSACIASVVDDGTMLCVDDTYEKPTTAQNDCLRPTGLSAKDAEDASCLWVGTNRSASEMFDGDVANVTASPTPSIPNTAPTDSNPPDTSPATISPTPSDVMSPAPTASSIPAPSEALPTTKPIVVLTPAPRATRAPILEPTTDSPRGSSDDSIDDTRAPTVLSPVQDSSDVVVDANDDGGEGGGNGISTGATVGIVLAIAIVLAGGWGIRYRGDVTIQYCCVFCANNLGVHRGGEVGGAQ